MHRTITLRVALSGAPLLAFFALACASSHEAVSPIEGVASEPLEAQVVTRLLAPNEEPQSLRVTAVGHSLIVDVVRTPAICAPLISAVARRGNRTIDVIATLAGDPAADCAPLDNYVVTYRATVPDFSPGIVTLRLFERLGDSAPTCRGAERITVLP